MFVCARDMPVSGTQLTCTSYAVLSTRYWNFVSVSEHLRQVQEVVTLLLLENVAAYKLHTVARSLMLQ